MLSSIIDTPRLHLRPLCLEDVAPCAAYMNNYEVTKWLTNPPIPYSEEDARGFITHMMETSAPRLGHHKLRWVYGNHWPA